MAGFGQLAATLTVHRGPGVGTSFTIDAPTITIGRHGQCDFQVNDTWVSRQHARITWGGAGYLLEDLGTVNGTFVNGERISGPHALRSGDILQFGTQVELGFQVGAPAVLPEMPAVPEVAPIPKSEPVPQSRPAPPPAAPGVAPMPESKPAPAPVFHEAAQIPEGEPAPPPADAPAETEMQEAQKAANGALTSAIVGLIICGLILAPSAIVQARKARKVLRSGDPGYGRAIAAEIIGWIGLALWVVALIYQFSDM